MIKLLSRVFGKKEGKEVEDQERYILWVTKFDGEGYSSSHYGWNRSQTYTHEEALDKCEQLKDIYHSIELIKYSDFIV